MSEATRQKLLVGALIVVVGFAGTRYLGGWLRSTAAGQALGLQRAKRLDIEGLLGTEVAQLQIDRLSGQPGELKPGRDPWRYGPAEQPPPKPPPASTPQAQPVTKPTPKPVVNSEPQKPRPPAIDVVLLGTFGPERRQIAVFADQDSTIINALVGDVVKDKFQVHRIGIESVDLTFVGFPDEPPARLEKGG